MQFIKNGPDIPEEIIKASQEDNLVLFCGSGISMDNELPNFEGLVKRVLEELNVSDPSGLLAEVYEEKRYDKVLDLLEGDLEFSIPKRDLRKKVIQILNDFSGTPETHKALLNLSRMSDGKGYRLVTTNFDRLFFEAGLEKNCFDVAPRVVPPRKGSWNNLTFLHGLIGTELDFSRDDLILTTTDFGLAYLHDSWASRFVIQLFSEFTVLFIGYSVNDPIMRYLISAISSGKKKHSDKFSIYSLVGYEEEKKRKRLEQRWMGDGITPIFYQMSNKEDHSLLHDTIKNYSESKTMGVNEKKQHLRAQLKNPYKDDDKVLADNVISFLKTDEKMAEFFSSKELNSPESIDVNPSNLADTDPSKPVDISWIKPFSKKGLLKKLVQRSKKDGIKHGMWERLSELEFHIMLWLISYHLDKQEFIDWIIDQFPLGNIIELNPEFKQILDSKLNYESHKYNLHERQKAFWNFLFNQSEKHLWSGDLYITIENLNKNYSYDEARKLISQLEPQITFRKTFTKRLKDINRSTEGINDLHPFYEAELTIKTYPYPEKLHNKEALLKHVEDFSDLLKKAMDLAKNFNIISKENKDLFFISRRAIEDHEQNNNDLHKWTYLVDLARDSFDKIMEEQDKKIEKLILRKWRTYPYSMFHRLILYAGTKYPSIEKVVIELLEEKTDQVLWSSSCQHELFIFLKEREHSEEFINRITPLILKGPSRSLYNEDVDDQLFIQFKEESVLSILRHLKTKSTLSKELKDLYFEIKPEYLGISDEIEGDRASFPVYSTGARLVRDEKRYHDKTDDEIFNDINSEDPNKHLYINRKAENFGRFSDDYPERAFEILCKFEDSDLKSAPFWSAFINAISFKNNSKEIFSKSFRELCRFDDEFIKKCLWPLVLGIEMKGVVLYDESEQYFKEWWERLWILTLQESSSQREGDPSDRSVNSNLGKLSHVIFYVLWGVFYKKGFKRNERIPKEIKDYFKIVLEKGAIKESSVLYHFGSHLYSLWFLDKEWVMEYIKPFMKADNKNFKALWAGYLSHAKWSPDFFYEFKDQLFELINHTDWFSEKDGWHNHYRSNISILFLMMSGGIVIDSIFDKNESRTLINKMGKDMLKEISRQLWISLEDSDDKSEKLWIKIKDWIKDNWPPQNNKNFTETAYYFSLIIIYSGRKNFQTAFEFLNSKIKNFIERNNHYILSLLLDKKKETKLNYVFNYPKELLSLLIWNLPNPGAMYGYKKRLKEILDKISEKHGQSLEEDRELKALFDTLKDICD